MTTMRKRMSRSLPSGKAGPRLPTESSCTWVRNLRPGTGNLTVDGSGLVNGFGGFTAGASGAFLFKPLNLGALLDVATHFEYWRLLAFQLDYEPLFRPISTAASTVISGTCMFAYCDDPDKVPASGLSTGQLVDTRNCIERPLDEAFTWFVRPKPLFRRLATSAGQTSSGTSLDYRTSTAGFLTFASSIASTFTSGSIGRIKLKIWVSLSGSNPMNQTLTLASDAVELKRRAGEVKEGPARAAILDDYVVLADKQFTTSTLPAATPRGETSDPVKVSGSAARASLGGVRS
jgi:hypothetical protein